MRFFFIDLVDRTFLDGSLGWGLFLFLNCFGLAHLSRKWKLRLRAMDKLAVEEHKCRWRQELANEECLDILSGLAFGSSLRRLRSGAFFGVRLTNRSFDFCL